MLDAQHGPAGLVVSKLVETGRSQNGPDQSQNGASELQLKDNVVEFDNELFWVTQCEVSSHNVQGGIKYTAALEGFSSSRRELQCASDFHGHYGVQQLRVHIFAGDYLNRYRCASELLLGLALTDTDLEKAVLNPQRRIAGTYSLGGGLRDDLMPINPDQRKAVLGLSKRLEIIHGPPGTGKSTTIFHMLSSRLPVKPCAAIVTCVTNQAIDAVSEKLAQTHDCRGGLRILVLGNPERVGQTAGQYTLENL